MKDPATVLSEIESTGVVAIIRAQASDDLLDVVAALREGGVSCVELTMTTPNALEVIRAAGQRFADGAVIGIGSVLDAETARAAILAGAQFVVTPILDGATIQLCKRYSKIVIPGAFSPTEIVSAWQAGADLVKVFPATKLGPEFFKDVKGPMPHIKLTPTGGVNLNNAADFIRAGAAAIGVGSALVSRELLASHDWPAITRTAAAFLDAGQRARQTS